MIPKPLNRYGYSLCCGFGLLVLGPGVMPASPNALFKTVRFKNKRIYWSDQFDFHLDQILERGHFVKVDEIERAKLLN